MVLECWNRLFKICKIFNSVLFKWIICKFKVFLLYYLYNIVCRLFIMVLIILSDFFLNFRGKFMCNYCKGLLNNLKILLCLYFICCGCFWRFEMESFGVEWVSCFLCRVEIELLEGFNIESFFFLFYLNWL